MSDERRPFKESLNRDAVRRLGAAVLAVDPCFPAAAFERSAARGLGALELKDRVRHVIAALDRHLPGGPAGRLRLLAAVGRSWQRANAAATTARPPDERHDPLRGFAAWPLIDFVGAHGLEHHALSMKALRALTPLFSAEFAIRPFLIREPERTLATLEGWTRARDEHVRRLVSEGTRPLLPWGEHLPAFRADPTPVVPLLEALLDDPSEYVRRSVANHLNDVSKDHPELAVRLGRRWQRGGTAASRDRRAWIVRHGLRTLVKQGHPGALGALGFDPGARLSVEGLTVAPARLVLGETLVISFELRSRSRSPQPLVVDFALHLVRARGARTAKVFKLRTLELGPGEAVTVRKRQPLRPVTTRRYYPGTHTVEILVNGRARARADFELALPAART